MYREVKIMLIDIYTNNTPDTINKIIRTIGGKRINTFIIRCSESSSFDDNLNKPMIFNNIILLKNNWRLAFCTYNLRNRRAIFEVKSHNILGLRFEKLENKHFILSFKEDGLLYWILNITLR